MPDRYIDQFEISIYGPFAVRQIAAHVIGQLPPFDEALLFLSHELESAGEIVARVVAESRAVDEQVQEGSSAKQPAITRARDTIVRFSKHLESHPRGSMLRRRFFTTDGTASGATKGGVRKIVASLEHIQAALAKEGSGVQHAADWLHEIAAAHNALEPAVKQTDAARTSRRTMTPAVAEARAGWLGLYAAAKSTVETVLRLTGQLELMPRVFQDLAVSERAARSRSNDSPTGPTPAPGKTGDTGSEKVGEAVEDQAA